MIESFYNFKKLPFAKNLTPLEIFSTDASRELHSRLEYMKDRRGILVVTGLSGVGKTLQLRAFTESLSAACYLVIYLPLSTVTVSEFYRQINASLGGEPHFRKIDVFASLQQQIKHLVAHEKKVPIIVLDEAHRFSRDVLLELQIIANFQMDSIDPALFILAGQPELLDRLNLAIFESLCQRIHLRFHVPPLAAAEVGPFLGHHLKIAGRTKTLFNADAADAIYQNTGGIHRKICQLAFKTLAAGALAEKESLTAEEVFLAARES